MTTEEQESQRVVAVGNLQLVPLRERRDRALAPLPRLIAPELVSQATGRDGDQPAAWVLRQALGGPLGGGGQQRLLYRVLARVEVPVATDEGAEDLRRELAEQVLDGRRRAHISSPPGSMIGRTSIAQYRAS